MMDDRLTTNDAPIGPDAVDAGTLEPDQVYRMHDGSLVMLDRRKPCDGSQWIVLDGQKRNGGIIWLHQETWIEPSDLAERLPELE